MAPTKPSKQKNSKQAGSAKPPAEKEQDLHSLKKQGHEKSKSASGASPAREVAREGSIDDGSSNNSDDGGDDGKGRDKDINSSDDDDDEDDDDEALLMQMAANIRNKKVSVGTCSLPVRRLTSPFIFVGKRMYVRLNVPRLACGGGTQPFSLLAQMLTFCYPSRTTSDQAPVARMQPVGVLVESPRVSNVADIEKGLKRRAAAAVAAANETSVAAATAAAAVASAALEGLTHSSNLPPR